MKKILLFFCFASLLSCATKKEVLYFQDIENLNNVKLDSIYKHPIVQVNDILKIDLTALEPESLLPYKFSKDLATEQGGGQVQLLKLQGYLVNKEGYIDYPGLGSVYVKGKNTQELQELLKSKLTQFIKDVTVRVRLVNFKFTVMGEVKAPGTYTISEETVTLPQALGMAGDLTIQGVRKNVLIIRSENGNVESKRIDLTASEWINSEYYFLRQNDMVYVEPNNPKVKSAGFIGNLGTALSVFSVILSTVILITR